MAAPIFVEEEVVLKAQTAEVVREGEAAPAKADDQEKVKEWLDSIKPGDFLERGKEPGGPAE